MDWGFHISVVITGISVVFLALIILIFAIWVMGKIMGFLTKKPEAKTAPAVQAPKAEAAPVKAVAVESEDGLTDEVVAAIAAAITCVMEAEGQTAPSFSIKSIKRVKGAGNAWNMAGVLDNTRPF